MSTVTAITPNFGAVGDSITISGSGFGASQGGSTVSFGGVAVVSYTSWSDTSLVVVVPAATPSGRVVVTVSGAVQTDYKASWFQIRNSAVVGIYDAVNGYLKAQDQTADSSPEDYRYADARDYNRLIDWVANIFEGYKPFRGARVSYLSDTAVAVALGSMASSDGKYLLSPAASASVAITTIAAINGLDETTLTATATTHGTATFEPSASVYSETCLTSTVKSLTSGTITGAGTTITGTSTKFLSELRIGDVLRSVSKGAARVTAIASDTSLTIAAAFPGGSPANEAGTLTAYENLIVRIAAETPQRVNTISHAGTSVVVPSVWTSSTSGVAIKLGGEIVSAAYSIFAVYGGSGTGYIISSQRTRPYGVTGYTTAWRFVLALLNNSSGNLSTFTDHSSGSRCQVTIEALYWSLVSGGTSTSYVRLPWGTLAPPSAQWVTLNIAAVALSTAADNYQASVLLSVDGSTQFRSDSSTMVDNGEHGAFNVLCEEVGLAIGGDPATYYSVSSATKDLAYAAVYAWGCER